MGSLLHCSRLSLIPVNPMFNPTKTLTLHNSTPAHGTYPHKSVSTAPRRGRTICCSGYTPPNDNGPSNFCIIEGPETVQDFVRMQLQEIQDNMRSRRNKIFLLMEELRRLRVQQHIKNAKAFEANKDEETDEMPDMASSLPFFRHMTPKTLKQLYLTSFSFISGIILFGGLVAPTLELKLGIGGTSYKDFIRSMHLPMQLSQVDPIVASFSGGAVGVISALMLIEANNVVQQEKKRCKYCHGTGYLACALCSASGVCLSIEPISVTSASDRPLQAPTTRRCLNCSGAGKVWTLDSVPGEVYPGDSSGEVEKVLEVLQNLPSQIPSRKWLVDHMLKLGFSMTLSNWLGSNLNTTGRKTWAFNLEGAVQMFNSYRETEYWSLLENPPDGIEFQIVRAEKSDRWEPDVIQRLASLATRHLGSLDGKVSVHVLPNAGHWVHVDNPEGLRGIVAPKMASLP